MWKYVYLKDHSRRIHYLDRPRETTLYNIQKLVVAWQWVLLVDLPDVKIIRSVDGQINICWRA